MGTVASFPSVPAPELVPTLGSEFLSTVPADTAIAPIRTLAECQVAVNERQELGERMKAVEAYFKPMKDAAHKAHRAICDREGQVLTPLKALDGQLRLAIQKFSAEQEAARRAEQQRQAEQQRREEQDRLTREAALLEAAGEHAIAEAVVEQAISTPAPVVNLPTVKQQVVGLKTRTEYRWRFTNNDRTAAEKIIPRAYMTVDDKKLTQMAKAAKGTLTVPGIEFFSEEVPVR